MKTETESAELLIACSACGNQLPAASFPNSSRRCRPCKAAYSREWQEKRTEQRKRQLVADRQRVIAAWPPAGRSRCRA